MLNACSRILGIIGIVAIVLVLPLAVLAGDAGGSAVNPWWHMLLVDVLIGMGSLILSGLGFALKKLFDWLSEKTKLAFLANVDDVIMDVVTNLYNTEVEIAKKAKADGKLTKEERQQFKDEAVNELKSYLGAKGLGKLAGMFGTKPVAEVLGAKVEKAVTVAKNTGKAARAVNP